MTTETQELWVPEGAWVPQIGEAVIAQPSPECPCHAMRLAEGAPVTAVEGEVTGIGHNQIIVKPLWHTHIYRVHWFSPEKVSAFYFGAYYSRSELSPLKDHRR